MTRNILLFICALIALVGSLTAAQISTNQRDILLHGYRNPTQTVDLPFRVPRLGVNLPATDAEALQETQVQQLYERGVRWVRYSFVWEDNIDWSAWDRLVRTVTQTDGISLFAVLDFSAKPDSVLVSTQANEFARQFGHMVDYYQIEHSQYEVSSSHNWNHKFDVLRAASDAIRHVDPGATIVAGLSAGNGIGSNNFIVYFKELYEANVATQIDGFAIDLTNLSDTPLDKRAGIGVLSHVVTIRELLESYGDGQKGLWITGLSWDESTRSAELTADTLAHIERQWPWLAAVMIELADVEDVTASWQPPASPSNGVFHVLNPDAHYSGIWTLAETGADIGWVEDSRATFTFSGEDLALLLRRGNYQAYLYPRVNGRIPSTVPRDPAGNGFITLRSGDLAESLDVVPVVHGLGSDSVHRLDLTADEIVPDEATSRWPLTGYAVSDGDLAVPFNRQIAVAYITAAIAFIGLAYTAARIRWRAGIHRMLGGITAITFLWQMILSVSASIVIMLGMLMTFGEQSFLRRDVVQLGISAAVSGIIYLNPPLIATVIAALVLFVLIYNRLDIGLMLVLFYAPFFLFPVDLYRFAFPMVDILVWITTAAWVLRMITRWLEPQGDKHRLTIRFNTMDILVLIWLSLGLTTLLWVDYVDPAATEWRTLLLQPVLFYIILRTLPRDQVTMLRLIDALLLAGVAVAGIGMLLWFTGDGIITAEGGARRLSSVYGSPNNVGLLLGRCIPFALAYVLVSLDRTRRVVAGIVLVTMLVAAILTQSAGALFIGIPAAVAAVLLLSWRRRAILPLALLFIIGLTAVLFALQMPRFARALDPAEGTNFYRVRVWQSAMEAIEDHPLLGLGLDQFLYDFRGTYMMPDAWEEPDLSHPHNIILDFWTRLGMSGVIWLIFIQAAFWRTIARKYHQLYPKKPVLLAVLVGTSGAMVNLLAHGTVDNSIYVVDLAYIFVLLLGIASMLQYNDIREEDGKIVA